MASTRIGKKTGPGRLRRTARPSAIGRISASAMQKIFTLSRKAEAMPGKVLANSWPSKKACWISGHPGALTIAKPSPVKTAPVLASAIRTARRPSPSRRKALPEDWDADHLREPGLVDLPQRPVRLHRGQRLVDAGDERVALLEHHAEVLARLAGELAQDLRVRDLDGGDVEGRRQVDHDAV